jgi:peptidoglycan/LPS O-acetylase OafA/YrhL
VPGDANSGSARIATLDSLRGVAALAVVIEHEMQAARGPQVEAHGAVMLFYMLSGFVLALPGLRGALCRGCVSVSGAYVACGAR